MLCAFRSGPRAEVEYERCRALLTSAAPSSDAVEGPQVPPATPLQTGSTGSRGRQPPLKRRAPSRWATTFPRRPPNWRASLAALREPHRHPQGVPLAKEELIEMHGKVEEVL